MFAEDISEDFSEDTRYHLYWIFDYFRMSWKSSVEDCFLLRSFQKFLPSCQRTPWGGGGWKKEGGGKPHEWHPSQKGVLDPPSYGTSPSGVSALFFLYKNPWQSGPEALLEGSINFRESVLSGTFSSPHTFCTPHITAQSWFFTLKPFPDLCKQKKGIGCCGCSFLAVFFWPSLPRSCLETANTMQLQAWGSRVFFQIDLCPGEKAHKHKLFALVNVQMALGQTAGCPRVNRVKKFMCSPRNTGNINFSLWLTGGLSQGCSDFQKVYVFKVYMPFLALTLAIAQFLHVALTRTCQEKTFQVKPETPKRQYW